MSTIVDVNKIIKDRLGARARYIPPFLITWLKRLIHQDWDNVFLTRVGDKVGTEWLIDCVDYLGATLDVRGRENLPARDDGKLYTFVSNHPLGGVDGVAIGSIIGQQYGDNFRYLVNDLLMNLPGLATLCVPINKTGSNGRNFPKVVDETFRSQQHVLMFPAGLCSRKINGIIKDLPWKKTFITKSRETHRDIVPIHFEGRNSNRFYNVANLCKHLKLKFNVAMLLLPDELYKNCNKTYKITIGKPIPIDTFDSSRSANEWAQWVYDQCYALAENQPTTLT